jgi:S1-C subfamily serine protease
MLNELSTHLADAVAAVAPSVVQVEGRRRPASGLVFAQGIVLTTMRAIGGDDGLQVRQQDGAAFEAELIGWDPTTTLALLSVEGITVPAVSPSPSTPRVGHLALAVARSWSNAVTASFGLVSVIGGPLPTGRRRAIDQVIRTSAPVHDGFSGGAFVDVDGGLIGVATATRIRGLAVVIPASIAWAAAARIREHGGARRGYLGILGQTATLSPRQASACDRTSGLLVVGVAAGSAAADAGVLVGDVLLALDSTATTSPEDLLDLLASVPAGRSATLRLLRGASAVELAVTIGERPSR